MLPRYDEEKATELAALLLERAGGSMPYLKLMKLMYLADRLAIERFDGPITFDYYVSMDKGPVLSNTLNIIRFPPEPESGRVGEHWAERIVTKGYDVELAKPSEHLLSEAEEQVVDDVFAEYGHLGKWELVEMTHRLPEWRDPRGSAMPIALTDIMAAQGKPRDRIDHALSLLSTIAMVEDAQAR
jgi:uncharacterized phage-associated protein